MQDIFLQYTLGASLKEIAEQLSKAGPAYDAGKSWNKKHGRTDFGESQIHRNRQLSQIS